MKALSMLQPWAGLLIQGVKTIETRSWRAGMKGTIYIHASHSETTEGSALLERCYKEKICVPDDIYQVKGAIIGSVYLIGCAAAEEIKKLSENNYDRLPPQQYERECILGDLSFGNRRIGWITMEPVRFTEQVPAKGSLSLWTIPDQIADRVEKQENESMKCRFCGCTWFNACVGGCSWVERNLCSKCEWMNDSTLNT